MDRPAGDRLPDGFPSGTAKQIRIGLDHYYSNAARMLYGLDRDGEAGDALQSTAVADPNTYFLRARLYQREQRLEATEREYRRGLAIKVDGGAWFELSRILAVQGQLAEAQTALRRAIRLSSQPLVLYLTLARFELASNQPQQALQSLQSAEQSSSFRHGSENVAPELYSEIAEGRAAAYPRMGSLKDAIEQQQPAVKLTPAVASRCMRLADLLESSGQTQAAAETRKKAEELSRPSPGHP